MQKEEEEKLNTEESRFLEPPGETQIGSRKWLQITLNWPVVVWL